MKYTFLAIIILTFLNCSKSADNNKSTGAAFYPLEDSEWYYSDGREKNTTRINIDNKTLECAYVLDWIGPIDVPCQLTNILGIRNINFDSIFVEPAVGDTGLPFLVSCYFKDTIRYYQYFDELDEGIVNIPDSLIRHKPHDGYTYRKIPRKYHLYLKRDSFKIFTNRFNTY